MLSVLITIPSSPSLAWQSSAEDVLASLAAGTMLVLGLAELSSESWGRVSLRDFYVVVLPPPPRFFSGVTSTSSILSVLSFFF